MKRVSKTLLTGLLALVMLLGVVPHTAFAAEADVDGESPAMQALADALTEGNVASAGAGLANSDGSDNIVDTAYNVDYGQETYDQEGGGYYIWGELWEGGQKRTGWINESKFMSLTKGARRSFLSDVLSICNNIITYNDTADRDDNSNEAMITADTVNLYSRRLQNLSGAGSQLIASLLSETKPDYATANQIYTPFSGVIGTILGLLSILIMALLGVSMGVDIAYIVIPAFQLAIDGDADKESGNSAKGIARIISQEAHNAVRAANDTGDKGQGGSGNKLAISVYFKHRWKSLVMLGICLLYLIQGQIYSFVAWVLDLVSGFAGF